MDAKDILGLPKTPFSSSQEKKSRPPKEPQRKPDGVSREVYALTGGVGMPPVMPTVEASHLKRRPAAEKEKVRVANGVQPTGDYQFAKYNTKVDVLRYTDEEYEKYLTDPVGSKHLPCMISVMPIFPWYHLYQCGPRKKTDQLFELCERFDLRFIDQYDAAHETERKRALSALLSQTKHQERKDADVRSDNFCAAYNSLDSMIISGMPSSSQNAMVPVEGVSTLGGTQPPLTNPYAAANSSIPNSLRTLRVYLRTHALDQMVQAASASAGLRIIKRVDQTLQDLGVHLKPKVPTKAVCVEHLELRNEILTLLNLQKQLQNKEAEVSANREGSFTEAPSTPKRSNRDMDRPFVPDTVGFTGERAGKRDHKRKSTTGRFIDAPPSPPQSKRPRKLKASD
ncbi:hypothetical protein PR202_ga05811 [Eleusine coracana subsp. coracana]|uniref:SWR1-complex protein 4 n=1 Tax=Eleusine coracana subsp. coracana TaxID=191504 RepID=A0AAV5BVM9_ELECO|nr:hypothetical protein PR202_ga05811 [Eleusine coracana subsp. coracana]